MAYKVLDIANKLLAKANDGKQELMSNLKLQKMLYYEQGFHLAYFNKPLFEEEIEAWMYGPVVPSVYEHYKDNGQNGILPDEKNIISFNSKEENALFDEVFDAYGAYSAIGLMNMTHQESPWSKSKVGIGNVITKEKMTDFFKSRLE